MPLTHLFPYWPALAQGVRLVVPFSVSVKILVRAKPQVNVKIQSETRGPLAAGRQAAQRHAARDLEHEGGATGDLGALVHHHKHAGRTQQEPYVCCLAGNIGTAHAACVRVSRALMCGSSEEAVCPSPHLQVTASQALRTALLRQHRPHRPLHHRLHRGGA